MSGAICPLPQYASKAWCLVKVQEQLYLYFTVLFFYVLHLPPPPQKKSLKDSYFAEIYYHIQFLDIVLSSDKCSFHIRSVYSCHGKKLVKYESGMASWCHDIHTMFHEHLSVGSEVTSGRGGGRYRDMWIW
jgi:hypothetical protein